LRKHTSESTGGDLDDLNIMAVACYGKHPDARTPALDGLAARWVRFANAQTDAPICGLSLACLLSGLLPATSGYFGFDQQNHHWRKTPRLAKAVTLMEAAQRSGYAIYGCGKIWHNGHEEFGVFPAEDFGPNTSHAPFGPDKKLSDEAWTKLLSAGRTTALGRYNAFGPLSEVPPGGWVGTGKCFRYVSDDDRDRMPDEQNAAWVRQRLASGALKQPFLLLIGIKRPHQPQTVPAAKPWSAGTAKPGAPGRGGSTSGFSAHSRIGLAPAGWMNSRIGPGNGRRRRAPSITASTPKRGSTTQAVVGWSRVITTVAGPSMAQRATAAITARGLFWSSLSSRPERSVHAGTAWPSTLMVTRGNASSTAGSG
jgi:hypothetical protein